MKINLLPHPIAMRKTILYTCALFMIAGCAENGYVGPDTGENSQGGTGNPISFGFDYQNATRATKEDGEAAAALSNRFIVWGEKNENGKTAATAANTVFQNYTVQYGASTAYTTSSNTDDWEYVGVSSYGAKLTPNAPTTQTIKYWDNAASSYTFTAVSALDADITGDKVVITKNTAGTSDQYDKGYTIVVKDGASYGNIFFADRINDTPANLNSSAVKLTFRNLQAKIRFGIYETIPGYKVKITGIYYGTNTTTAVTDKFGIDGNFIKAGDNTSFTVTYESSGTNQNKAKTALNTGAATDSYFETAPSPGTVTVPFMSATEIGTEATNATFNKEEGSDAKAYTAILPNPNNNTNLKLKIKYQLISEDTGETIDVDAKEVQVPAAYCQWLSNYAYSYLFKITDKELTPITFDALTITDEIGNQETITTVTEPSITTFGVKGSKYSTGKDEYEVGTDIYATFMKGSTVLTPQLMDNDKANFVKVYAVKYKDGATDDEKTAHPITELSVANAIEHTGGLITATHINTSPNDYFTDVPTAVTTIPGEDGNNKTVDALKLEGAKAAGKYAVEIVTYEKVTLSSGDNLSGYYSVDNDGKFTKQTTGTYSSGDYYKQTKTYKVITVVSGS